MFGPPDSDYSINNNNNDYDEDAQYENEFPEAEIDEMRVQRDLALDRYVQEIARKEAAQLKAMTRDESVAGETDDARSEAAPIASEARRKKK